jgi:putative spermidine/putrescine transport system permease protein
MSIFKRYAVVFMLFPALILLFFFFLVPLSLLLAMSFYTYVPGKLTPLAVFTLENYKIALFNSVYRDILISTLRMSLITTFFTVLLAYPIAYKMIRTTHVRAKKFLMTFLILSFFMVIIIRVFAFIHVLGDGGMINQLLVFLGFKKMNFIGKEVSVIISMVHQIIPLAVLSLMGSIKNIEPEYE